MCLFLCETKHLKHLLLHIVLVNTNASSSDLSAVQDDIVSFCTNCARIGIQKRQILVHRHGERVMHCGETVLLIGPLQKRELGNPYETVFVLVEKSHLLCQFQTKCAKNVPNNLVAVCCEEKKVSSLSVHGFDEGFHLLLCHKFGEGRFPASILMDCNVCKTFCTVTFRKLNELVDFLSRHCALSLCVNTADRTAVFKCALKYNELGIFYGLGNINQLHTETQVRFVGTETVHSLFPGHSLDRELYLNAEHLFEQMCQQSLIDIDNIIYINESKLHIDLGELRLTVGTQVLVTETFYDLDITVIAGAHQKLFEQLRRLRQCVEAAWMNTARYQVISGAFRCRFRQHRGFDLKEAFFGHELTGEHCHFASHNQVSLDIRATQIQITVFQTELFSCFGILLNREWRGFCLGKDA